MIVDTKPYPMMKDSGVPWLEEIPVSWDIRKLRGILRRVTERNRPELPLLSVVRERGVIRRDTSSEEDNHNFIPDDLSNYKVVRPGQFAMNKMKAWQGSYGVSEHEGIVSPAYFVFNLAGVEGRFFHMAIRSRAYVPSFAQASDGIRIGQWDLSEPRMREIPFAIPPLAEQTAIVRFLDYMDRRIRRYIRAKQKLIELLDEQKQAIIHRAVTRGLDPNVGLKPSGVEWLGDVPEHWEVVPLKRIGSVRIGLTYSPGDVCDESGTLVLRASNIRSGKLVHADDVHVSRVVPTNLRVKENDILVCVRSGSRKLVGKSALIPKEFEGVSYGAFMSLLKTVDNRFYYRVLNSNLLPTVMAQFETSTINQLTQNDLRCLVVPVPPETERAEITAFLDAKTGNADAAMAAAAAEIKLLREYRTRLIADVVTGKLDVREAAARLPEEGDDSDSLDESEAWADGEAEVDEGELGPDTEPAAALNE